MIIKALKLILPLLVLAGAYGGMLEIANRKEKPKPRPKEKPIPVVRVLEVVRGRVQIDVETYGTVRPRTEISIVPQVSGRVEYVSPSLRQGGFFEAGEELVRIEDDDYELAETQAKALVAQAWARLVREEAEAEIARREWEKFGKGEASALVLRRPQLDEAKAVLASAGAKLEVARLALERTTIHALFDGRVRSESVDRGQFLVAGVPIASVFATDYAEVRIAIPDDQLPFLDLPLDHCVKIVEGEDGPPPGLSPVELSATYAGKVFRWTGLIVRAEAEVDRRTRVVHVLARVEKPFTPRTPGQPPLMVGMYLQASIRGPGLDDVIVLPRSVLLGRSEVHVVDAESRLRRRTIEILRKEKARIVVTGGLEVGERVCLTRVEPAVEGMLVKIEGSR